MPTSRDIAQEEIDRDKHERELGKMHDTYESDKRKGVSINTNIVNVTNAKQIERLSDEELLKLAGFQSLDPVPAERVPVIIDQDVGEE